jgi:hypothetical protein
MAIQIIDNFNLSVAKPIDDRFVVGSQSFYTDKNNIPYKYTGLRIWDLNDGVPYVWNGSTWASENSVSVSGSGNVNYVPKFIGSGVSNTIGESCIYISGSRVGINNNSITAGYNLDVNGGIKSQGATGFSGVGTLLTNLNATNISSGLLQLQYLTNDSSGKILTSGVTQPTYVNPYTLTVGFASASTVVNETTNTSAHYLSFFNAASISGSGQYQSRVSVVTTLEDATRRQLTYKPSTGNLTSALITTGTFSAKSITSTNITSGNITNSTNLTTGTVSITSGYLLTSGSYLTIKASGANSGFFFQNNTITFSTSRSLYMDSAGDLITGGNGTNRFNNFRLENGGSLGATASSNYFYIRDNFRLGTNANTGANGILQVTSNSTGTNVDGASFKAYLDGNHIINFINAAGSSRGKIQGNGSGGVLYTMTSDLRLKKDITNMNSMVEKIKMLKPSNYKWKSDDSSSFGFIAQEVYNVFPELRPTINSYCDSDSKDFDLDNPVDKNGNPYYYGLDYGVFTPFLTKALQEVIQNYEDLLDKIKNSDSLDDLKNSL